MSKIAHANYTLKATAAEGEAFQVLGVGDSQSQLPLSSLPLFLPSRGLSQVLETNSGHGKDSARMSYLQGSCTDVVSVTTCQCQTHKSSQTLGREPENN